MSSRRRWPDGRLGLDLFADGPVRPELAALAARVERRIDPDAPPVSNDPATRFSTVEIRLADGRTLSRRVDRPLPADDLAAKFRDATGAAPALRRRAGDRPQHAQPRRPRRPVRRLPRRLPETATR